MFIKTILLVNFVLLFGTPIISADDYFVEPYVVEDHDSTNPQSYSYLAKWYPHLKRFVGRGHAGQSLGHEGHYNGLSYEPEVKDDSYESIGHGGLPYSHGNDRDHDSYPYHENTHYPGHYGSEELNSYSVDHSLSSRYPKLNGFSQLFGGHHKVGYPEDREPSSDYSDHSYNDDDASSYRAHHAHPYSDHHHRDNDYHSASQLSHQHHSPKEFSYGHSVVHSDKSDNYEHVWPDNYEHKK